MRPDFSGNVEFETLRPFSNDVVTEDSAALRFVEQHSENLRYCHSSGS
jgi:putative DNA primase/helicase